MKPLRDVLSVGEPETLSVRAAKFTHEYLVRELEDYVVNGCRHPCLRSDQPSEEAAQFLIDLCASGDQTRVARYLDRNKRLLENDLERIVRLST